jgi:DNA polymerase elongation subunit (family B)
MNYYEGADKTTALGRKVMKDMIDCAQRLGSTVVKVDTDGMLCTVPKSYQWGEKKGELDFITAIENLLKNDSVDLDHDGRYAGTMIVDKKSYVLKKYDGTMDYKGNTLTGRDNQPFTLKFLKTAIDFVFKNDYIKIKEEYDHWVNMIESGLINAHELRSRKNLNMTIEDYTQKVESGNNPITQYELARKAERNYTKGDAIEYYISSPPMILREYKSVPDKLVPKKMANYEKAKLLPEYDSDPDVKYYKKRLDKTATKLIIVLGEDRFKEIFPNISINKREREKLEIRNKMMS